MEEVKDTLGLFFDVCKSAEGAVEEGREEQREKGKGKGKLTKEEYLKGLLHKGVQQQGIAAVAAVGGRGGRRLFMKAQTEV